MKNLILILAMLFVFVAGANAQRVLQKAFNSGNYKVNSDTVINAGSNYLTTLIAVPGANSVTVQWVGTLLSGTGAGTVVLTASLDGVNFTPITATNTGSQTGNYTVTNTAKQSASWTFVGSPYVYYKVTCTGSGTMSLVQNALLVAH